MGIDLGSTGVRAAIFSEDGDALGSAYRELVAKFPRPGWVEQDPEEMWQASLEVIRASLETAGVAASELAAVGIANQRSSVMAWEAESLRPLSAMIGWQDTRAEERCAELLDKGFFVTSLMAASKAEWILNNEQDARGAADRGSLRIAFPNSWLAAKLTGGAHVCDRANASATGLYAYLDACWDGSLLDALGVEEKWLPEIVESAEQVGVTQADIFGAEVPVAGMCGDQQASLFGLSCRDKGATKCSFGTAAMLNINSGDSVALGGPGTYPLVAWSTESAITYCLEATVVTAGAAVQWLRDGLGLIGDAAESSELARSVPDSGGVWAVPAFQGLGTPSMDSGARAMIGGLSRGSGPAEITRAVLDGVAHRVVDAAESLWQTDPRPPVLRVDGGASRNDYLMGRQADLLGIVVERGQVIDAAALGAAELAGLGSGLWGSQQDLDQLWHIESRFEPGLSEDQRLSERELWGKRLEALSLGRAS